MQAGCPTWASPTPFERMRVDLRNVQAGRIFKTRCGSSHAGLAALWAHELGDAEWCAEQLLTNAPAESTWNNAFGQWLFGLVAEARGKGPQALTHLQAAISDPANDLPFYAAHMLVDHARIAHLLGDPAAAEDVAGQGHRPLCAARRDRLRCPDRRSPSGFRQGDSRTASRRYC